jgi:RNA polymerase sigma-70 factor (ECF subfamily)
LKKDSKVVRESIQNAQFDRLVRHHKDSVYRQLYRMCGNHDDAEDALAETLLKAYNALEGLQSEEALSAWLAQIARRTCGRMKKREQLRPVLTFAALGYQDSEFAGTGPSPAEELLENELKGCILEAYESLPEGYAAVYLARDIEGKPTAQVARELGLSVAAVKSRLHRARAMVREHLDRLLCAP